MNLMRMTLIDAGGGVSFVAHGEALPALLRACATGPDRIDTLLDRVEETVMEEYRRGRDPEEARKAIRAALDGDAGSAPSGGANRLDQ